MKRFLIITGILTAGLAITGCGEGKGNDPGETYMPDMAYSRAYETYNYNMREGEHDLKARGVYYNGRPVIGTIARGDEFSFPIGEGDSGYAQAKSYRRTDTAARTPAQEKEAERLYLINCAICHGAALDGNGPLWKGGDGPYPAAPRNLKDDYTKALSDGQMFHVITYGKGQMGSYASQLKPEQRWWIVDYMRKQQAGGKTAGGTTDSTAAAPASGANATGGATDTTTNR